MEPKDFFQALYEDVDGCIELVLLKSWERNPASKAVETIWTTPENLAHSLEPIKGHPKDIYFGVCPRATAGGFGNDERVCSVPALWVDMDGKGFVGGKDEALAVLERFQHPPSAVVDSGNGFHAYWLLKELENVSTEEERTRIKGFLKGLVQALGADSCFDLRRILRVPGTQNRKDPQHPLPVTLRELHPERRYLLSDFEGLWVKVEEPPATVHLSGAVAIPDRFRSLLEESEKLQATWDGNRPDLQDQSGSGYDMALACLLVQQHFTDDEIAAILTAAPYEKRSERTDPYLSLTIGKARACAVVDPPPVTDQDKPPTFETLAEPPHPPKAVLDFDAIPRKDYRTEDILLDDSHIIGSGFFEKYLRYVEQTTDAPREFVVLPILTGVAAVLGNKVWVNRGSRIYPNLYALLIGPSTILRKSTCLNCAEAVLSLMMDKYNISRLIFPSSITPEALYEHLALRSSYGFWKISEFGSFLKSLGRNYMSGFKEDLTNFYDVPRRETRTRKAHTKDEREEFGGPFVDLVMERPAISLCAGSTIDWLRANLEESDVGGGWLARFVFSVLEHRTTDKIAWPEPLSAEAEERWTRELAGELYRIYGLSGEYTVAPDARALYEKWYTTDTEAFLAECPDRTQIEPFVERYATVALKVAMLLQASKGDQMRIDNDSMLRAIGITGYFVQTIRYLLAEQMATGWTATHCRRFVEKLKEKGGIAKRREVQTSIRQLTAAQFAQVAQTLIAQGQIEELEVLVSPLRNQTTTAYKLL